MASLLATSCTHLRARNVPLERIDPEEGYRQELVLNRNGMGDLVLLLGFSGGGTRAAALSYGVLQELRDTHVALAGGRTRLLDEVDLITSVSGGSFTSAYYALHGDRTFEEYESRFLKRSVSRDLFFRLLWPHNWIRLLLPFYDRTELAIDYYDAKIFDDAKFSDLIEANGPMIQINSTDISIGAPFSFTQPDFDSICSDLSELNVSRAVTASSAVPIVFPTIVLANYAGTCGYEEPPWIREALASRGDSARRFNIASERHSYLDRSKKPYVHLVDGGIADNLGVRGPLDEALVAGGLAERWRVLDVAPPKHVLFIVVDASTNVSDPYVLSAAPPSLGD
ncbi:MAG: patatin-like phospholipase family protein, partial [Myxococcota bacterium]